MNGNKLKVFAICGSTRINSSNESILRQVADLYTEYIDVEIYRDLAALPHFNPDVDDENISLNVKNLRHKILESDGVLICTPEYVFSLPGSLKNAIEWTVSTTVFSDKPVAFIIASGLGDKAYESLNLVMTTVGANIAEHSKLLIKGARSKLNDKGEIVDDKVLQEIDELVKSFIQTMNA